MLTPGQLAVLAQAAGATNLSTNPSFESDTANWSTASDNLLNVGATLTRITTDSFSGTACGQVVTTALHNLEGISQTITGTFTAGQPYTVSAYLKSVSGSTTIEIQLGPTSSVGEAHTSFTITTSWARYSVTWTPGSTVAAAELAIATTTPAVATFNVDAVMLVAGSSAPAYFDGNTPGCSWAGTTNDSQSSQAGAPVAPPLAVVRFGAVNRGAVI